MRKLCTIQPIANIEPIPGADAIEVASIKGWKVVIRKGELRIGDLVAYFEIDSLIKRTSVTEFLFGSGHDKDTVRLRTITLRGQISQGLVLSIDDVKLMAKELQPDLPDDMIWIDGMDLSDVLMVEKYEPPVKMTAEGRFVEWPFSLSQTDEERIQNIPEIIQQLQGQSLCASVKLDGTSMTVVYKTDRVHVAGRTGSYDPTDEVAYNNAYWKTALKYNLPQILTEESTRTQGIHFAVQGELVGPGIQKNRLGLKDHEFYIFNLLMTIDGGSSWKRLDLLHLTQFCQKHNLKMVPYYLDEFILDDTTTVDSLLELSKRKYVEYFPTADLDQPIEGLVIRTLDHQVSFKVINNEYLLKGGD